jgi:predicted NUDIX family NTP pyrophosphohydrolase
MKRSAGLLMYRRSPGGLEVLLAHPGGPFFSRVDLGVWFLPKGLVEEGEDWIHAARREFEEETGHRPGEGPYRPLGEVRQAGGKHVVAWAFEGDVDPSTLHSNSFEMEWPRGSGKMQTFPEMDRFEFFGLEVARRKLNAAQVAFLDRLSEALRE